MFSLQYIVRIGRAGWINSPLKKLSSDYGKKRKEEIYAKQELIRKIWEYIGWFVLFCTIVGFIFVLAWLYKEKRG